MGIQITAGVYTGNQDQSWLFNSGFVAPMQRSPSTTWNEAWRAFNGQRAGSYESLPPTPRRSQTPIMLPSMAAANDDNPGFFSSLVRQIKEFFS